MGAQDYLQKPSRIQEIDLRLDRALMYQRTIRENVRLREEFAQRYGLSDIVGEKTGLREVFSVIDKAAPTDASIFVVGEPGTGKEQIARTIHSRSLRAAGPFVAVNCPALPEDIVEGELFGYEPGAFSGATKTGKPGRFELADGGTLFLDEVTRLSLAIQGKLLRPIQFHEFERVGGTKTLTVDVRVIAATCHDVWKALDAEIFLPELCERFSVIQIRVPPLRERRQDIVGLAHAFLRKYCCEIRRNVHGIEPDAIDLLNNYHYPGNVRELENIIERALILSTGDTIKREDIRFQMQTSSPNGSERPAEDTLSFAEAQARWEKQYCRNVLRRAAGVVKVAAALAGMDPKNFRVKMKKHGLDRKQFI